MIMIDIPPSQQLLHARCGHTAHLVETRGRIKVDPRLLYMPARQFHVECVRCGVATKPVYSQRTAEALWLDGDHALVPLTDMPALRIAAEQSLLAA